MTRTECIHAAITKELDRRQRWIDSESGLLEVQLTLKIDRKTGRVRFVHMAMDTEREIEERAA